MKTNVVRPHILPPNAPGDGPATFRCGTCESACLLVAYLFACLLTLLVMEVLGRHVCPSRVEDVSWMHERGRPRDSASSGALARA